MAKKSSIEKNNRRKRMTKNAAPQRAKLKAIIADKTKPMEERFAATLKLSEMPQLVGHPDSQPLRTDRPSAFGLSQEQAFPHRAA